MRTTEIETFEKNPGQVSVAGLMEIILGGDTEKQVREVCAAYGEGRGDRLPIGAADFRDLMWAGLTKARAIKLAAAIELGRRVYGHGPEEMKQMGQPKNIAKYFMPMLRYEKVEHFMVLYLDNKLQMLGVQEIAKGNVKCCTVDMAEIMRWAIRYGAVGMVLVHNHPSGDTEPSKDDKDLTKAVAAAANLLDLEVYDHIIIGENYFSFHDNGLM